MHEKELENWVAAMNERLFDLELAVFGKPQPPSDDAMLLEWLTESLTACYAAEYKPAADPLTPDAH